MPDDDKLTPADPRDVVTALSLGLTAKPARAQHQAAETMAKIVAERIAEHLDRSGFVVMRKSVPATGAGDNPGRRGFGQLVRAPCALTVLRRGAPEAHGRAPRWQR